MNVISRVGVDLAKQVIQVHGVDAAGKVAANRALARGKFIEWCVHLPAECLVAMEASSGVHHWCRKLVALGLDARIIPTQMVLPYRLQGNSGKNDANDAAAICEAASHPQMHFVTPKTMIAVGTPIAGRPPRTDPSMRNSRTRLPPWVLDDEAIIGPGVKDSRCGQPGRGDFRHPLPRQVILLYASGKPHPCIVDEDVVRA